MTRKRTPGPYLPIDINFDSNPKIAAMPTPKQRLHARRKRLQEQIDPLEQDLDLRGHVAVCPPSARDLVGAVVESLS